MDSRLTPEVAALASELPLSIAQREVWLDQLAWPVSVHLNIGGGAYLEGPFDHAAFLRALQRLIDESEALRLVPLRNGRQRLLAHYPARLDVVEMPSSDDPCCSMAVWWDAAIRQPFDLNAEVPPWRFTLLRASPTLHGLTIQFHHLIMDGWGTVQVMKRWAALYAEESGERPVGAAEAECGSYLDYVEESRRYQASRAFVQDSEYWRGALPDLPPMLLERRYGHRYLNTLPPAQIVKRPIARDLFDRIGTVATRLGATAFAVFVAMLAIYFARTCNRSRVSIGVPSMNRGGKRFKQTLGMFVGVLVLDLDVDPERPATDVIDRVARALRSGYRARRYPLSELGRERQIIQHGREGLFDVLLSFEKQDYDVRFGEARLTGSRQLFSGVARYPLGVTVCEFHPEQDIELVLEASEATFAGEEPRFLADRFVALLDQLADDAGQSCGRLALMPAREREHLVWGIHAATAPRSDADPSRPPLPFIRQFERLAAQAPEAIAVVWDGGQLAYGRLDHLATALADTLRADGVVPGDRVAVLVERSPQLMVSLLAVAKRGAAFLLLDPEAPRARLEGILGESAPRCLLHTGATTAPEWGPIATRSVRDVLDAGDATAPSGAPVDIAPADAAYVLYTSGSSGRPKGVVVSHGALASRLAWVGRTWQLTAADRAAAGTQVTFDPALIEWCLPLTVGASVALPPPGRLHPRELAEFTCRHAVTFMAFVPSTLSHFLDGVERLGRSSLRVACCGGEVLAPELAERFRRLTRGHLFNVYGPTEATIFATAWRCVQASPTAALPVGTALDGTRIYIVGDDGDLQPLGVVGEICIAGAGVADGYVQAPAERAPAFMADRFFGDGSLYRTGDGGWLSSDGVLHFIGRRDRQIKLNGYRIELGEIESVLLRQEGVKQAAAVLVDLDARRQIYAWVAVVKGTSEATLLQGLRGVLPDYMVPAGVTILPALPTTDSGKVDYAALPRPTRRVTGDLSRFPSSQTERDLVTLWEAALQRRPIGVTDNFFDLGGDSFAALELLTAVERQFGRRVSLQKLAENPTVQSLAVLLGQRADEHRLLVPLTRAGTTPHLFLAASGHGDAMRFNNLAAALAGVIDVSMLQPPASPSSGQGMSMPTLAAQYAEALAGEAGAQCILAGFSVGGVAALETARRMESMGTPVAGLVLIDTVFPSRWIGSVAFWKLSGWMVNHLHLGDLTMNGRRLAAMFADPGLMLQVRALHGYRAAAPACRTLLVKSSGLAAWDRLAFRRWRHLLSARYGEATVNGLHGSVFERSHVGDLAKVLAGWIVSGPSSDPRAERASM